MFVGTEVPIRKGGIQMFGRLFKKITKEDLFYLVAFGLTLVFLYFSMITSG